MFELGVDVPSEKWVFHLGWMLKKFQVGRYKWVFHLGWVLKIQVGRYKFQVGVGGKTKKSVLIRVETATKPIEIKHVLGWKI